MKGVSAAHSLFLLAGEVKDLLHLIPRDVDCRYSQLMCPRRTGIIKCIRIDISFLRNGDPMTIHFATEPGNRTQVILALYADAGGLPAEMLSIFPLIRMDIRGDGVDDQMENAQPAEIAGKPVALSAAFYNVLAIAAGELHDCSGTQGIV